MAGVTQLSIELLAFFSVALLALLGFFFYVVWWRRRLRRRLARSAPPSDISGEPCKSPSKELLYFLWLRGLNHVEPTGDAELKLPECEMGLSSPALAAVGQEVDFQQLYDRAQLYTIKEEKEIETESESEMSFRFIGVKIEAREVAVAEAEAGEREDGEGQFFTPCSSPPFSTPTSSPPRALDVSAGDHIELALKKLPTTDAMEDFQAARLSFSFEV